MKRKKNDVSGHWYSACDGHLKVMRLDGKKMGLYVECCKDTDGFNCGFLNCKKKAKWEVYFLSKDILKGPFVPFNVDDLK